ncbi:hypothetical protein RHIZO_03871 [Rhizobiaceae bacterium]|nr:hypothetical protein RHIZO_03871 [Rhizobiaceae bacterium]
MISSNSSASDVQHALNESMRTHWGLFLAQGIIMIVLGVLAVLWPQISTIATDIYIGWLFLFSGLVGLVAMFWAPTVPGFVWSLLTAALTLVVGVLLLWHPIAGVVSLTLALIAFFVVEGIFQIAAAIRYRNSFPDSWGWMAMSGVADLVLAGVIISGWPGTAVWALGLIVGVNLFTSGLAITMTAIAGRNLVKAVASATR